MLQLTPTRQLLPEQQPFAQLVVSQTQVAPAPLPEQRVPVGQAPPVEPHTQALAAVSQRFVVVDAQVMQAEPMAPHALSVSGVVQLEPVQQPDGQSVELQPEQTPSVVPPQVPPAPQEAQVDPL